jgi:hypothetical protein
MEITWCLAQNQRCGGGSCIVPHVVLHGFCGVV